MIISIGMLLAIGIALCLLHELVYFLKEKQLLLTLGITCIFISSVFILYLLLRLYIYVYI